MFLIILCFPFILSCQIYHTSRMLIWNVVFIVRICNFNTLEFQTFLEKKFMAIILVDPFGILWYDIAVFAR